MTRPALILGLGAASIAAVAFALSRREQPATATLDRHPYPAEGDDGLLPDEGLPGWQRYLMGLDWRCPRAGCGWLGETADDYRRHNELAHGLSWLAGWP